MSRAKKPAQAAEPRLSRLRAPAGKSAEEWQTQLRRQFGREQAFTLQNLGSEPVFSEFLIANPASRSRYRVAIRGASPGENFCGCTDFATNDLGTCKHIEFTLARLAAKRGGKAALKRGFHPPFSEVYLHYAGQRSVRFRAGAGCPPELLARAERLFDMAQGGVLPMSAIDRLPALLAEAERAGHEIRCYDDALAFIAELRDARERQRVLTEAYPKGAASKALASLLKTRLYPYQAEGALFAVRAGRALIGDEMGLGKTIQAIAAAELFTRHFGVQRVLVVCPTSLKHQWQREIARFAGREAQVINGLRPLRERLYAEEAFCKITNYETLARDDDLIKAWAPELLIVDEAQRVKNWNTIAARALKRIASTYAIVLTGTPLENRLEELISIVQFVDQHRLGPTWRLLHQHQTRDDSGRVVGYRDLDRIGATLAPILLRRRKAEVLAQLPERIDNTLFVPMTAQQRLHHDENGDIVARIVQRWRKTGFLSDADQKRLTCALQNMRMSCNSTFLLDHETDFGAKADELATLLDELFERPEAKAVVFSQWLRTHELIVRRLEARGWGHVLFHGGVPGDERGVLVDRFHQDAECRVFLSTDAGGVGLNLQHAAATVVNMDLPWNPAVLEQRIGRVHRMGQEHSVQVVNFVAQGSIEEGMLSVLAFKKSLFAGVLDGGESAVFMNGTRLAKFMQSVQDVTGKMGAPEGANESADLGAGAGAWANADTGVDVAAQAEAAADAVAEAEARAGAASAAAVDTGTLGPAAAALAHELPASASPAADAASQAASPPADPWAPLVDAGLKLVASLAAGRTGAGAAVRPDAAAPWIETDSETGRQSLKLPLPEPATVQRLADALQGLLKGWQR